MKTILSERNIVVVLFIMVLITFSLAQEDSKKIEKLYSGVQAQNARFLVRHETVFPSAGVPDVK